LDEGIRRVGNAAPFLPHMVTLAKLNRDEAGAEQYTRRCNEEEQKTVAAPQKSISILKPQETPSSGLYADCIRRLGRVPANAGDAGPKPVAPAKPTDKPLDDLRKKLLGG